MQDRPNEYALEYKLGSEDERQFLVFTTTDFRLVLSTPFLKSRNGPNRTISNLLYHQKDIHLVKLEKVTHLAKS